MKPNEIIEAILVAIIFCIVLFGIITARQWFCIWYCV